MRIRKSNRRDGGRESGQSLVEFTLSVSLLMTILVGVLDLGRAYMVSLALQNAAGEGALFAAIHPTWKTTCPTNQFGCNNPLYDNITARSQGEAPEATTMIDWSQATVDISYNGGSTLPGEPVTVTISYQYHLFTPILSRIWPTFNLQGVGVQMIMGNPETP